MKKIYLRILFICGSLSLTLNAFSGVPFEPGNQVSFKPSMMSPDKGKLYGRLYFGIGLPVAKTTIGTNVNNKGGIPNVITNTAVKGSFGKGSLIGIGIGYLLWQHAGLGLDISNFKGATLKTTSTNSSNPNSVSTSTTEASVHGIKARPTLVLFPPRYKMLAPFVEIGVTLSGEKMTRTLTSTTTGTFPTTSIVEKSISQAFSLGGFAGMGTAWNFTQAFGIFAELQLQGQTFAPKHDVTTVNTLNGIDQLPNKTVSQKETDYVTELNAPNGPPDTTKPAQALRQNSNCAALNILLGITFNFGKAQRVTNN